MSDFAKKISFAENLSNAIKWQNQSDNAQMGWQLPCKVAAVDLTDGFVTVDFQVTNTNLKFPQITIPVIGWRYIRYPIQVGDAGLTISIDTNLNFIAGQASGITSLTSQGNLGPTLAFMPIMQTTMANSDNPQAVVVVGPQGVILRDDAGDSVVTISPTGIRLQSGTSYISIAKNGAIDIEGTAVTIMGRDFVGHEHKNVQSGTSNTGGVV